LVKKEVAGKNLAIERLTILSGGVYEAGGIVMASLIYAGQYAARLLNNARNDDHVLAHFRLHLLQDGQLLD